MVERTEAKSFEEFEGVVENVETVDSKFTRGGQEEPGKQYKISIKTDASQSGYMYTWVGIPATATGGSVPQGSVIDAYVRAIERLETSLKKAATVQEVFDWLKGKKFQFSREQLGKAFGGHEAADYWVPVKAL